MLSIQIFPHLCKSSLQGWGYSLTSQMSGARVANPTEQSGNVKTHSFVINKYYFHFLFAFFGNIAYLCSDS